MGADEGSRQLTSPLGNEEACMVVGSFKMGVGGVNVSEGLSKLTMEAFTFVLIPLVHGAGSSFNGRRGGSSIMGVCLKGSSPNSG